ncbi:MAG: tail fiber protein [Cytophagaceae bacterium]|nr:tail fiber protein [Cytophagaceae bacterium]
MPLSFNLLTTFWQTFAGPSAEPARAGASSKKQFVPGQFYDAQGDLAMPTSALSPWIGEIIMFAGNFAPYGWAFCDGSLLATEEYPALFDLIGTAYGGNGTTDFALPDLRGRIPVHQGQGPGLDNYVLAQRGGSETVTLAGANIPLTQSTPTVKVRAVGTATTGATNGRLETATTPLTRSGSGEAHDNMPPYSSINFCISLSGIFPSRP